MCNAWNHSIDCTCGWGGEGHSGRRPMGNAPLHIIQPKFKTYSEFLISCTIPNAKCPECGSPVFFYRSPSNGRVFLMNWGRLGLSTHVPPVLINQSQPIILQNLNL